MSSQISSRQIGLQTRLGIFSDVYFTFPTEQLVSIFFPVGIQTSKTCTDGFSRLGAATMCLDYGIFSWTTIYSTRMLIWLFWLSTYHLHNLFPWIKTILGKLHRHHVDMAASYRTRPYSPPISTPHPVIYIHLHMQRSVFMILAHHVQSAPWHSLAHGCPSPGSGSPLSRGEYQLIGYR